MNFLRKHIYYTLFYNEKETGFTIEAFDEELTSDELDDKIDSYLNKEYKTNNQAVPYENLSVKMTIEWRY